MANITEVPKVEQDKYRAEVEKLRRNMPLIIENGQLRAHIFWTNYQALLGNGFNPQQALELCRFV